MEGSLRLMISLILPKVADKTRLMDAELTTLTLPLRPALPPRFSQRMADKTRFVVPVLTTLTGIRRASLCLVSPKE